MKQRYINVYRDSAGNERCEDVFDSYDDALENAAQLNEHPRVTYVCTLTNKGLSVFSDQEIAAWHQHIKDEAAHIYYLRSPYLTGRI